jgi:hypothetical protein
MSAVPHTPALSGSRNGGVAARRAVIRWAGRIVRREWRQQVLIVALLTIAVAAAVASITIVYNTAPADDAEHGSAAYILRFDGTDRQQLQAELASAKKYFGTTEVIGHRTVTSPAASRRSTSARRTRTARTRASCSLCAAGATRRDRERLPSRTESRRSFSSSSARTSRSTGVGGRSSASSRTRAS